MKHIIELDESDIRRIIADKFSVPTESVSFDIRGAQAGYGTAEYEAPTLSCSITTGEGGFES